jgi:hypothetical protein
LDAGRFNSRRTRACPGTLATGSCSLAVGRDRPGVRPPLRQVSGPACPFRAAKISKTPTVEGGGRGYPEGRGPNRGSPSEPPLEPSEPERRFAARFAVAAFLAALLSFPFFPPNIVENTKRERNEILLGVLIENTSENFSRQSYKLWADLALWVQKTPIFDIKVSGGQPREGSRCPKVFWDSGPFGAGRGAARF